PFLSDCAPCSEPLHELKTSSPTANDDYLRFHSCLPVPSGMPLNTTNRVSPAARQMAIKSGFDNPEHKATSSSPSAMGKSRCSRAFMSDDEP
ncbi:hypothetical protein, partial [Mesorhizobium sp.]|uniref:hypothetical protein n=1 Tax=Mesorhizobium sp. TaxID=1871066 RepID=UPI00257A9105